MNYLQRPCPSESSTQILPPVQAALEMVFVNGSHRTKSGDVSSSAGGSQQNAPFEMGSSSQLKPTRPHETLLRTDIALR